MARFTPAVLTEDEEQLRSEVRAFLAGELPPGCQLATETKLRELYRASRNTVRDAIKVLTTRGLVETRPGQGTFVVARINPFVTTLTQVLGSDGSAESGPHIRAVRGQRKTPRGGEVRIEISRLTHGWPGNCNAARTTRS